MAASNIIVELTLKNGEYIANLKKAEQQTKDFTQKSITGIKGIDSAVNGMSGAWKAFIAIPIVSTVVAAAKAIFNFGMECLQMAEHAEDFRRQIEMMTGSAESTARVISDIQTIADSGVFPKSVLREQARELLVMGESADSVGRILGDLANYAAGTGQSLESITTAYGRMAATGQVNFRVIRQFGMPVIRQLALDMYGTETATNRVTAAIQRGEVSFNQVRRAIDETTNGVGRFANAMREQANDSDAQINRIQNTFNSFKRFLGENLFAPMLRQINDTIEQLRRFADALQRFFTSTGSFRDRFRHLGNDLRAMMTLSTQTHMPTAPGALQDVPGGNLEGSGGHGGGTRQQEFVGPTLDAYKELMVAKGVADQEAADRMVKIYENAFNSITGFASTMVGNVSKIQQMEYTNEALRIDNWYQQKKDSIEATITDETAKAAALDALDAERDKKLRKAKRTAAKNQKATSSFETIINTATGAIAAYKAMAGIPYVGPALGAIAAAVITAFGMKQLQLIQAQPLPELYEGGIIRGTSAGTILKAGERGQSEVIAPLNKLESMFGNRTIQLVVDGRVLTEVVDNGRNKRAASMGARNYSYSGVY